MVTEPSGIDPSAWTLDDTLNMASMSEVDVSPDGKKAVYSVSRSIMTNTQSELLSQIYLSDTSGANTVQLTQGESSCYSPQWSPDGKQVAFLSAMSGKNEIWVIPAAGGEAVQLTHVATAVYLFRWSRDGSFISYMAPDPLTPEEIQAALEKDDAIVIGENDKMVRLWTVSTRKDSSGEYAMRRITNGDYSVLSWDWSPDGKTVTFVRQQSLTPEYEYPATISRLELESGALTDLVPPVDRTGYNFLTYSPDGKWIAFATINAFYFSMDVSIMPSEGGQPRILAKEQDEGSLLHPLGLLGWSSDSKYLYLSSARGTTAAITALPVDGSAYRDILTRGYIAGGRMNSSRTMLGLIMEDFTTPQEVYAAALAGNDDLKPVKASNLNARLPLKKVWNSEVVRWPSRDGLMIEGILTYPASGEPGQRYPLVVEIHGGPSASFFQYYAGGRSWYISPAGAFAARGFALLRPNIRGSAGYGADFTRANYRDWGGKDYQDMLDGVDYLVNRGVADPDRLAIMGQSYGGYMTAWTVTQTDKFKAAAMISGISNLISDAGTLDILHYERDYFGSYFWEDYALYLSRSPIMHVEKVTTPTLILHGQLDPRVPLGQGQEFYNALKLRNVPTKMVVYPRSGHFPGEPKLIRDMWEREIDWFKQYFPPYAKTI
ncbi:MAG: S9 family peptidase [Deltaproteobacteria bacterium]|nr:S9 family peptidase [Deltaproteobacteria bacterium]